MSQAAVAFPEPIREYKQFTEEGAKKVVPPRPPDGPFNAFGKPQEVEKEKTLEEQNIPVMYDPKEPPLMELKKINHEILFAYQKLFGILAVGNEDPEPCLERMKSLFLNAHYLLHKLRKVQAYEHMHFCLNEQKRQLDIFKKKFDDQLEEIAKLKPP